MIKLKLNKEKLLSVINAITLIIEDLEMKIIGIKYDIHYCRLKSDLMALKDISRQMRAKHIRIENLSSTHKITLSISEVHGFVIMYYYNIRSYDPYTETVLQNVSADIQKHFLN